MAKWTMIIAGIIAILGFISKVGSLVIFGGILFAFGFVLMILGKFFGLFRSNN